ncbi:MAG: hypothetical protein P1P90_01995 [Patescibacteria group bacterium]|nr:hypothetical protein [Patescibacteria group bacterium]
MKIITSFIVLTAALFITSHTVNAAETISSGDLIKASTPAVYYYGADGKRYVFPTEKTFLSWYDNFDSVKTITDAELASLPIGGNVTYRPGVRMIKITTDPKTYAVGTNGILRHITSEEIAVALYGSDWNTKIDDIPDTFFVNYNIGDPITNVSQFTPADATSAATNINSDKGLTTSPPDTCTDCDEPPEPGTMNFSVNDPNPRPGDTITFTANANESEGVQMIKILVDENLVTTCNNTTICTGNYPIPLITDSNTLTARAEATFINQTSKAQEIQIQVEETTLTSGVKIYADRTNVKVGQSTGITVDAQDIIVKRIEIFVDGAGKAVCESGSRTCKYSLTPDGGIGTFVTLHGIVTDSIGRTYRSENLTVTVTENDSPLVTIQADKNYVYTGESLNVTVTASDQDGIQYLEILDQNRQILKHCDGAAPCTYNIGPWNETGAYTFYGRAADAMDATDEQSTVVTVTNP